MSPKQRTTVEPNRDQREVFYRKVGKRYKPVGSNELPCYPEGHYLVRVNEGCISTTCYKVDPAFAEIDHALHDLQDLLC